jgi:DNA-binding protein HU-beta
VNKQDLVAEVSARLDISKRAATDAVDAIVETIKRAVASGDRVSIPGFGTFDVRWRSPRAARNPQTGAKITVPAARVPVFRPGRELRSLVEGRGAKRR